jgi:Fe2+ or Zn2+ uptake regulation protein
MIKNKIVKLLERNKKPTTVVEILQKIPANKTTIYRELASFVKDGLINEIEFGDGKKRYEIVTDHHHHLICKYCGNVEDIEINEKILFNSLEETNFKVENHSIEFFGKCINCK